MNTPAIIPNHIRNENSSVYVATAVAMSIDSPSDISIAAILPMRVATVSDKAVARNQVPMLTPTTLPIDSLVTADKPNRRQTQFTGRVQQVGENQPDHRNVPRLIRELRAEYQRAEAKAGLQNTEAKLNRCVRFEVFLRQPGPKCRKRNREQHDEAGIQ